MNVHVIAGIGFDSNQFLIGDKKPILIDTGSGLYVNETIRFIEKHGGALDKIILTHRHIDHVGGAKTLSERFGCELFISPDDSQAVTEGRQDPFIPLGIEMPKLEVKTLEYGEVLNDYGLEVIHTPGHTIGCIVLFNKDTKTLFSGDTVFAHGGVGRWDLETGDGPQLLESISKLSELGVEDLYPGHGPIVKGIGHKHIQASLSALEGMGTLL